MRRMFKKRGTKQEAVPVMAPAEVLSDYKIATMDKYIACECDANYSVLTISGEPTPDALGMGWLQILSDHITNVGDASQEWQTENKYDETAYYAKRHRVLLLCALLDTLYYPPAIDELRAEEYDYEFTRESIAEDLTKVRAEIGSEGIQYDEQREADKADGKLKPLAEEKKATLYKTIAALNKEYGICTSNTPVSALSAAKVITVYEYGLFLKEHNERVKRDNTSNNNNENVEEDVNGRY